MLDDCVEPFGGHAAATSDVLEERANMGGLFGATERQ
jgi:hypothetical protein